MTLFQILSIISATVGVILLYLLTTYNGLIRLRNRVKTDFSDVDVQLHRRSSIIQSLVELVKTYAKHEKDTFTDVAKARAALDTSVTAGAKAKADNMLTETLRSLMMVTEAYPELKANKNFQELHRDLLAAENMIARYREEYNKTVERFNNTIQTFPNLLVASLFVFESQSLFQAEPVATKTK
ncbi:MAG: hypothetical protein A2632_00635 [Candidatus Pacebacteria bacterium RIFCSPHIGHO2_01_FULL_46_16]|nr:MAG: hypothetical protein A2632_00635 [Candidatus Pacebacteria bacterium RIFCSPHIGHO2_01_FULL_46_16]OGJ38696.1 MAG: hypothetical protein A3A82_03130 [Candidatus Pacebacteria bacterium RIFCSPLOWO2_01_FULL_47_12]